MATTNLLDALGPQGTFIQHELRQVPETIVHSGLQQLPLTGAADTTAHRYMGVGLEEPARELTGKVLATMAENAGEQIAPIKLSQATKIEEGHQFDQSYPRWQLHLPQYGNYGGPDYSAGKFGGDPYSTEVKPVDELDALFQVHDQGYTEAKNDAERGAADRALILGIAKLLATPGWAEDHENGARYGVAAMIAFGAKESVRLIFGSKDGTAPPVRAPTASLVPKLAEMVFRHGVLPPVYAYSQAGAGGRTAKERTRSARGRYADAVARATKLARSGDVERNPGPTPVGVVFAFAPLVFTSLERSILAYMALLLLVQGVEPNPGPTTPMAAHDAVVAPVIDAQMGQNVLRGPQAVLQYAEVMDATVPHKAASANLLFGDAVPPVSTMAVLSFPYHDGGGIARATEVKTTKVIPTLRSATEERRVVVAPQFANIVASASSTAAEVAPIQAIFAMNRTNWFAFHGQDWTAFIQRNLETGDALGIQNGGSYSAPICRLLALGSANTPADVAMGIDIAHNVYPQGLQDRAVPAGAARPDPVLDAHVAGDAPTGNGIFPFSVAYNRLAVGPRVEATVVTFGTFMQMQNAGLGFGTVWSATNWNNTDFAIVPLLSSFALDDPSYVSTQILSRIYHPFCLPYATKEAFTSQGVTYGSSMQYTPSLNTAIVDGPHPLTNVSVLYVMMVLLDIGDENGGAVDVHVSVGSSGAAVVLVPTAGAPASTLIGDPLYHYFRASGAEREDAARRVLQDMLPLVASKQCVEGAMAWLSLMTSRVGGPTLQGTAGVAEVVTAFYVADTAVAVPTWPVTGWTRVTSAGNLGAASYATTPYGALWYRPTVDGTGAYGDSIEPMLAEPAPHLHGELVRPNVWVDMIMMIRLYVLVPEMKIPNIWRGTAVGATVRLGQQKAALVAAWHTDRLAEAMGADANIWYASGAVVPHDMEDPKRAIVTTYWAKAFPGLRCIFPTIQHTFMVRLSAQLTAYPVARVPLALCNYDYVPDDPRMMIGTSGKRDDYQAVRIGGVQGMLCLSLQDEMGLMLDKPFKGVRMLHATGSAGGTENVSTIVSLATYNGTTTYTPVAAWWARLWAGATVWTTMFGYPRTVRPSVDTPCLGIQPTTLVGVGVDTVNAALYYFTARSSASSMEDGMVPIPSWYLPVGRGSVPLATDYTRILGGYDPIEVTNSLAAKLIGEDPEVPEREEQSFLGKAAEPGAEA